MKKSILFAVIMLSAQAFAGGSDVGSVGIQSCKDQYNCQADGGISVTTVSPDSGKSTAAMQVVQGEAAKVIYDQMTLVKEEPCNIGVAKRGPKVYCVKASKSVTCYLYTDDLKNGNF